METTTRSLGRNPSRPRQTGVGVKANAATIFTAFFLKNNAL